MSDRLMVRGPRGRYRMASRAEILLAASELRIADMDRERLDSPAAAKRAARVLVGDHFSERFGVIFLDARHRLIAAEILFNGTIDSAVVYPREILKRVIELNAAAVILTHNHPTGEPTPSEPDRSVTLKIAQVLRQVEVRVLDHIIVGSGDSHESMAERGML